jgi:histidine triad (HIT) family protein
MALSGEYDNSNIFAKILGGEIPCAKVYEDEAVLAFMDVFPQSKGHTLVIPKSASRNLFDTDEDTLGPLMLAVQKIGEAIIKAMSPCGVVITQFNGAPAGQTVFHLHFHIIPRYEGRELSDHGAAEMASAETLAAQARLIAAHL